jgi:hypothetical protein
MFSTDWLVSEIAAETVDLRANPVVHRYRYCPSCRREWPSDRTSCPQCVRWLGDAPLERIERQLAPPSPASPAPSAGYEVVGGCAIVLRVVSGRPSEELLDGVASAFEQIHSGQDTGGMCGVGGLGWLVWRTDSLRRAFLSALDIERRLVGALPQLEKAAGYARFRWGMWLDQYVLPFGEDGRPAVTTTARAIFNFEPDNLLLLPTRSIGQTGNGSISCVSRDAC